MSLWDRHLGGAQPLAAADDDEQPLAPLPPDDMFDDEYQEPVARPGRQRVMTMRRHKEVTREDIQLANKLWLYGWLFLPFLWLINYVAYRHALAQTTVPEQMKNNVRRSLYAFLAALTIWGVWLGLFYSHMREWAEPLLLVSHDTNPLD